MNTFFNEKYSFKNKQYIKKNESEITQITRVRNKGLFFFLRTHDTHRRRGGDTNVNRLKNADT